MATTTTVHDAERVIFLDNLRYLMVLLVVVLHASVSYCSLVPWWAVSDSTSVLMDMVLVGLDIFLMPVLFFIAGYFGSSSFRRHGTRIFLKTKFKRLAVPILISSPITGCLFAYIHHSTRGSLGMDTGLWSHWRDYMASALKFHIGQIPAINHFNHSHLWFMSVLLFFFLIFALIQSKGSLKTDPGNRRSSSRGTDKKIFISLILVGFGSALTLLGGTFLFASPGNPEPWFIIANLIEFQPHKLVMYALYFCLGVYAAHTQWFLSGHFPGNLVIWIVSSMVLFFSMLTTLKLIMANFSPILLMMLILSRSFCCLTILAALLTFAIRRWNSPSRLDALLSANSYHIYIIHFIVVCLLQLLLLQWSQGPVLVKFGIISVASIVASLGLSQYIFRPYPLWGAAVVYFLFGIGLATLNPGAV